MMGVFVQVNEGTRLSRRYPLGYVIEENGCWSWVGNRVGGYGKWPIGNKIYPAHRVMYERAKGPIPAGLQLDHLCRNTGCVNPDHLEAVTGTINVLRGTGPTAQNARKTHCKNGHPLTKENIYLPRSSPGQRSCKLCARLRAREWEKVNGRHGCNRRRA